VSENAYLERKTVEALRRYRDAFAAVENLEREEAFARRALTSILPDLSCALLEEGSPSIKRNLFESGQDALLRSDEAWAALTEATAKLDSARLTLAALEQQLGYTKRLDSCGRSGLTRKNIRPNLRVRLSGPLIASRFVALVGIDALLRAAAPGIGKLRKLVLQRMPASFDGRHVVDELPNLAR
jgi:hypothetical protein